MFAQVSEAAGSVRKVGRSPCAMLTKHQAAGNDFLVLLDEHGTMEVSSQIARDLCARHTGVGADGLIRVRPASLTGERRGDTGEPYVATGEPRADLSMRLLNADGSEAETSGNGLRCLAQAAVDAGWVGADFAVLTGAGVQMIHYAGSPGEREARARVTMGRPVLALGDPVSVEAGEDAWPAYLVDMGNPHIVLMDPVPSGDPYRLSRIDLAQIGSRIENATPGGTNVELITGDWGKAPVGMLYMRVWERGVGETLACGSGTTAAAAAARAWGLVGAQVSVHNDGGVLEVDLSEPDAVLGGPVCWVARVEVPWTARP